MITRIAEILFFGFFALSAFVSVPSSSMILAVLALVVAIGLIIGA